MKLNERISKARKDKGYTHEELADLAQVTVRTIQRVEYGESVPRSYTLKAIAKALDVPYETWTNAGSGVQDTGTPLPAEDITHFLKLVNLSCFSYLVIPWAHFLIPNFLLKKRTNIDGEALTLGRKIVRQQVYWVVILQLLMLLTLAYNLLSVKISGNKHYTIHYLCPFFFMYFLNAGLILYNSMRIQRRT